ncbi:MAG: murein transglycosylase [Hyphomicrobiales bacterium]|nr:murein transglycosylase [Hyphomicrobiales bacterium]
MREGSDPRSVTTPQGAVLTRVPYDALAGFANDDLHEAMQVFLTSCRRMALGSPPLRLALPQDDALSAVCARALRDSPADPLDFFTRYFSPFHVHAGEPKAGPQGFATGYYEPQVLGAKQPSAQFSEPVYLRPADLVNVSLAGPDGKHQYSAARQSPDGALTPYPTRAQIETARMGEPCLWLEDAVELFMIQVQGSGRVRLPDGEVVRLVYDGRNGRPYTSIGRILVTEHQVPVPEASLEGLKSWVRKAGQGFGEAGRELLHRNESYIFFKVEPERNPTSGPIGGEGVPLFPLRSLAIDRGIWSYGLPIWIAGMLPDGSGQDRPFQRLMIAQDTGSAIVGPARCDVFVGRGDAAGRQAAQFRHPVDMFVFLPNEAALRL